MLDLHAKVNTVIILAVFLCGEISRATESGKFTSIVEAARLLLASLTSVKSVIASTALQDVDAQNGGLKQNLAFFSQWIENMEVFAVKFVSHVIDVHCDRISTLAAALEQTLPNWKAMFQGEKMNETLIKKHILSSPHKDSWFKLSQGLDAFVKTFASATVTMALDPPWDDDERCTGAAALAAGASRKTTETLAVTSDCNVYFNFGKSAHGPTMAKQVFNSVANINDPKNRKDGDGLFELPKVLADALQTMADNSQSTEGPPQKKARMASKTVKREP
eukprot:3027675-Pyramimonas_sp.AAC.1